MDAIVMTKSKVNDCISVLNRMDTVSTHIALRGNCAHLIIDKEDMGENLKKNGVTCAKSVLPLTVSGCVFISNSDFDIKLKMLRDAVKEASVCKFIYTAEGCGFVTDDIVHPLFQVTNMNETLFRLYEDYGAYVSMALGDDDDTANVKEIDKECLNKLVQSKVVKLDTEFGKIRISKNNLPLLGVASANKPANFKAKYCVRQFPKPDGTIEYVLVLNVEYNKLEAVHLFTVEPY